MRDVLLIVDRARHEAAVADDSENCMERSVGWCSHCWARWLIVDSHLRTPPDSRGEFRHECAGR